MKRALPEEERRKPLTISLNPVIHDWVYTQSSNISRWIESILEDIKSNQEYAGEETK